MRWHTTWDETRRHFKDFWDHNGMVLVSGIWQRPFDLDPPRERLAMPPEPTGAREFWLDPDYRASRSRWELARTPFSTDGFPFASTQIGPGSLALYLGAKGGFSKETVWFEPVLDHIDRADRIVLDPANPYWKAQLAIVDRQLEVSRGDYGVALPDLVEGLDVLASLRGAEALLIDLLERPQSVKKATAAIDRAWGIALDTLYQRIALDDGSSSFWAFGLWADGRVAKLQCDISAMLSNAMFEEFAVPGLTEQCRRVDRSLYHLDGTQALRHLESLLAIEELDAIEWTAQAGVERGGDPRWYPLYRKILEAGKSVQILDVRLVELVPLLNAIGTKGVYVALEGIEGPQGLAELESIARRHRG